MITFYLVDVKNITSNIPRSNFTEADLENLADIIIDSGGIIRPLVLKATGAENYTVVDGHFEYYAAARAKEKNPRKGEMVNAFVISPKIEDIVAKQAAILRGVESSEKAIKTPSNTTNLEPRLANLELRLEKQFNELKSEIAQERQRVDDKLKEIQSSLPQENDPLNLLNTLDKDELSLKLQRSRVPGAEKIAKAIVDARRSKKPKQEFEDYRDVVNSVKGLGDKRVLTIIDEWSKG
jgi:hypothetical protein